MRIVAEVCPCAGCPVVDRPTSGPLLAPKLAAGMQENI